MGRYMKEMNHDLEKRKQKLEESTKAVDSLNDTTEMKARVLEMLKKWKVEDEDVQEMKNSTNLNKLDQ
jgi:hypothetical protein